MDERIVAVAGAEDGLPTHVGEAQAVAVAADTGHDALEEAPVVGLVERAEAERVQDGDGARAHGEDVPDDAPDSRRRALIWLYGRRVVVGLDLHHHGQAVAYVDDTRVLGPGGHQQTRAVGGEHPQQSAAVLVAAVLAPQ